MSDNKITQFLGAIKKLSEIADEFDRMPQVGDNHLLDLFNKMTTDQPDKYPIDILIKQCNKYPERYPMLKKVLSLRDKKVGD